MKYLTITISVLLSINVIPKPVDSANILVVLFAASKSHKNVFDPLLHELAGRGHSITVISPIKASKEVPNIRNINGKSDMTSVMQNPFLSRMNNSLSPTSLLMSATQSMTDACREYLDKPEVMELKNAHFDLVMTTFFANDCSFGFIDHLKAPFILVSTVAASGMIAGVTGSPQPPSFIPFAMSGFSGNMNFVERVKNFIAIGMFGAVREYFLIPKMEAVYKEYFPDAPGIKEFEKNVSLILSNGHFTLNYPRPLLPDVVDVGGMHCRPAQPLPKELDEFLSGSGKAGFIYFSLGSIAKGSQMPESIRKSFLAAFAKLKQRVIWKWETEEMKGLPPNVKLAKWLPQQDVLGHPNIKMFITHGGLLSTQEAVYHGVPIIGIPLFGDQDWNMKQSENSGYALTLELKDINEEILLQLINRLLTEPQFGNQAKKLSKLFRDQPDKPLDRAVFWTEYVIRHKGATHMRSAGRYLNFFQYHSIDVIVALLTAVVGILFIIYKITRLCFRKISKSKSRINDVKKTN